MSGTCWRTSASSENGDGFSPSCGASMFSAQSLIEFIINVCSLVLFSLNSAYAYSMNIISQCCVELFASLLHYLLIHLSISFRRIYGICNRYAKFKAHVCAYFLIKHTKLFRNMSMLILRHWRSVSKTKVYTECSLFIALQSFWPLYWISIMHKLHSFFCYFEY